MIYILGLILLAACITLWILHETPAERDARIKAHEDEEKKDRGCK